MAKYKILVIAHLLKNNQVGKFNQIVDEVQLTTNPNELVQAGFIELVNETETVEADFNPSVQPEKTKKSKTKK